MVRLIAQTEMTSGSQVRTASPEPPAHLVARLHRLRSARGMLAPARRRSSRRSGVPLARLWPYPKAMRTKPLAFAVHLLTGSGAALALMALVAATRGEWRLMFGWLGSR